MRDWYLWAKASGIRAIKTMAQTAIATIGTSFIIADVDWRVVLSASALSGLLSVLTSLAGLPEEKIEDGVEITDRIGEDEADAI